MCESTWHHRSSRVRAGLAGAFVMALTSMLGAQSPSQCAPSGPLARVDGAAEASGLALSRVTSGRLWTHNDSGSPSLIALDTRGAVTARVPLGVRPKDWEAVAVGPCPQGSCVFIADIGDNDGDRPQVTVYRIPEPTSNVAGAADAFHATYPDGAHNAEALLIAPDGRLFIVTKDDRGPAALYRFPAELQSGRIHQLERIAIAAGSHAVPERITDGSVSPDGKWAVLRSEQQVAIFDADEFFSGRWTPDTTFDVTSAGEAKGEGVAMGDEGALHLVGEGRGEAKPGTFVRFACQVNARGSR